MKILSRISGEGQGRKKTVLAVCACLFAASLTYRILNPYEQKTVTQLTFTGKPVRSPVAKRAGARSTAAKAKEGVLIDLFLSPPPHSGKVQKNVFFLQKSREPENRVAAAPPIQKPVASPAAPASVMDKRLKVQEELSRFKSFGFMQQGNQRILFLERGKDIFVIRVGDRIDGKYLVKSITEKALIIRAESIDEDVRIELGQF
jgi:hypothetical protein